MKNWVFLKRRSICTALYITVFFQVTAVIIFLESNLHAIKYHRYFSPPYSSPIPSCLHHHKPDCKVSITLSFGKWHRAFWKMRTWLSRVYYFLYLLTYSLTPRCRVLLVQLTGLQPVKKFPAFHGTRRFITAFTNARHLSLSWASSIHSIPPHPTS